MEQCVCFCCDILNDYHILAKCYFELLIKIPLDSRTPKSSHVPSTAKPQELTTAPLINRNRFLPPHINRSTQQLAQQTLPRATNCYPRGSPSPRQKRPRSHSTRSSPPGRRRSRANEKRSSTRRIHRLSEEALTPLFRATTAFDSPRKPVFLTIIREEVGPVGGRWVDEWGVLLLVVCTVVRRSSWEGLGAVEVEVSRIAGGWIEGVLLDRGR